MKMMKMMMASNFDKLLPFILFTLNLIQKNPEWDWIMWSWSWPVLEPALTRNILCGFCSGSSGLLQVFLVSWKSSRSWKLCRPAADWGRGRPGGWRRSAAGGGPWVRAQWKLCACCQGVRFVGPEVSLFPARVFITWGLALVCPAAPGFPAGLSGVRRFLCRFPDESRFWIREVRGSESRTGSTPDWALLPSSGSVLTLNFQASFRDKNHQVTVWCLHS